MELLALIFLWNFLYYKIAKQRNFIFPGSLFLPHAREENKNFRLELTMGIKPRLPESIILIIVHQAKITQVQRSWVAQLVEQWLPTPEIRSSNPVFGQILSTNGTKKIE